MNTKPATPTWTARILAVVSAIAVIIGGSPPVAWAGPSKPKPAKTASSIAATPTTMIGKKLTVRGTAKAGGKPLANTKIRVFYAFNTKPTPSSRSQVAATDHKGRWKTKIVATKPGSVHTAIRIAKTPTRTRLWRLGPKTVVTGPSRPRHPDVSPAHPTYSGQPTAAVETESAGPAGVVLTAVIDWEPAGPVATRMIEFTVTRPDGMTPVAGAVIQATVEEHPAAKELTGWEEFEVFRVATGSDGHATWTGMVPSMIPYFRYRVLPGEGITATGDAWTYFGARPPEGTTGFYQFHTTDARFTVCDPMGTIRGCYESPDDLVAEVNWLWERHGRPVLRNANHPCEGWWDWRAMRGAGGGYKTPGRALWNNRYGFDALFNRVWVIDPASGVYGLYGLQGEIKDHGTHWSGNLWVMSCQTPDPDAE